MYSIRAAFFYKKSLCFWGRANHARHCNGNCRGRRCRGRRSCCPWRACPWPPRWRSARCRRCRSSTPAATISTRRPSGGWSCWCCPRSDGAWAPSRPWTSSPASPPGSTRTAAPAPAATSPTRPSVSSLPRLKVHTHQNRIFFLLISLSCLTPSDLSCVHCSDCLVCSVLDYSCSW
ncbi:Cyclin-D5-1 [Zea mays]|uniref:Cyclin-D5-1 n=1 Tax=Zea mays TaxID=4577 RepID=A0A1D6MVK4_MAIZE|nr:Cyclin-D5-1 [Zea mays]